MLVRLQVCVLLVLSIGSTSVSAANSCTKAGQLVCMSCRQVGKCAPGSDGDSGGDTSDTSDGTSRAEATNFSVAAEGGDCPANQACLELSNDALCVPVQYTNCDNCNGQPTACDPYNDTIVQACVPGGTPVEVKKCENTTCRAGDCSDIPPVPDPSEACSGVEGFAYVVIKPTCNTAVLCGESTLLNTYECADDQYFDLDAFSCKSLPIKLCDDQSDGFFSNPTNCSEGVICSGGIVIAKIPCDPEKVYNIEERICAERTDETACPPMDGCTFEPVEQPNTDEPGSQSPVSDEPSSSPSSVSQEPISSSSSVSQEPISSSSVSQEPISSSEAPTSRPSTCSASNVNQRYPHETDCKKYYTCRKVSSSTYRYVESTCPGTLLFNSDSTYCDLASNVSNC